MAEMEEKMEAILGNPQLMQQIMAMAQSLNNQPEKETPPKKEETPAGNFQFGDIDLNLVKKLSGIAQNSGIDNNQQTLLKALNPYLSSTRIQKLEKAMRAAKMASLATSFIGSNDLLSIFGR